MTREPLVGLMFFGGALIVVGRGLLARRLPAPKLLMLAAVWAAIFAAGYLLIAIVYGTG